MPRPSFAVSPADAAIIRKIAQKAFERIQAITARGLTPLDLQRDLTLVHANGCPLRLESLLAADDVGLANEVTGIVRYLDRDTGRLGGGFSPRFRDRTAGRRRRAA